MGSMWEYEAFVKNMIMGSAGIDIALLVVAADDGVMPQTREHLDILCLLGIQTGMVVITKKDLVDDEWIEVVKDDIAFAVEKYESKAAVVRIDADKAAVGEKLGKPAAVMAVCDKGFAGKAKEILSAEGNSAENTINQ